jgi:hypothetical protein
MCQAIEQALFILICLSAVPSLVAVLHVHVGRVGIAALAPTGLLAWAFLAAALIRLILVVAAALVLVIAIAVIAVYSIRSMFNSEEVYRYVSVTLHRLDRQINKNKTYSVPFLVFCKKNAADFSHTGTGNGNYRYCTCVKNMMISSTGIEHVTGTGTELVSAFSWALHKAPA